MENLSKSMKKNSKKTPEKISQIPISAAEPPDPPEEVLEALRTLGFDSFRPGQAEAVMRVLSGISTLLLLPTGSGKSLCYQLPAFLYHRRSPCISIVISPLVSLMDDQVSGLPSALKAVCIHSNLTPSQREAAIKKVRSGRAQILLLSPESVTGSEFFSRLFRHFPPVAFACLDEAHCISQWSHNFRPAYLRVCKVLRERLGVRCFLGLTATATVATARDVAEHLGIPEGNSTVGTFGIPENLRLSVSLEADPDQVRADLGSRENFGNCGDFGNSVIVYCTRREESERLAALIHNEARPGLCLAGPVRPCAVCHAGLSPRQRRRALRDFAAGRVWVLCGTACVGLGIHCGRVRAVLLRGGTACAESFLQHVGRAGRDGQPARGHLCLHSGGEDFLELRRRIHENSVDFWAVKALVQRVFAPCQCPEIAGQNPENSQVWIPKIEKKREFLMGKIGIFGFFFLAVAAIETLLAELELHPGRFLRLLPPARGRCRLRGRGKRPELLGFWEFGIVGLLGIWIVRNLGFEDFGILGFGILGIWGCVSAGSPRFPAQVFGRDRRFWRRLLSVEFRPLARLAALEILAWQ
uniref:DNA 3'-5' helicase n=1 Tax=Geospiza parvula TaxID=87175 RepID=A0A8U8CI00_GEOPR